MTFPSVLRMSSAAVLLAIAIRYVFVGSILVPPFVTIVLLILLSFSYSKWPRFSASVSLVPGLIIPVLGDIASSFWDSNISPMSFPNVVFVQIGHGD